MTKHVNINPIILDAEFNSPVRLKYCHKQPEIVVIDNSPPNIIEVNGIQYKKRDEPERKPISKSMLAIMATASMFGDISGMDGGKRKRPTVNLIAEYKLIQSKQSNLSANDRNWVVKQFEKDYVKI